MAQQSYRLWGVDAVLEGHESRLLLTLPVILSEGRFGVARDVPWSVDPERSLKWIPAEEDCKSAAITGLISQTTLRVAPGQVVILMGPKFREAAELVLPEFVLPGKIEPLDWVSVQEGFQVCCSWPENSLALLRQMAQQARDVFDEEYERAPPDSRTIGPKANAALLMLNGNDEVPLDWRFVRRLAVARLARDPDAYRRALFAAEVRLKIDTIRIEQFVDQYVQTIRAAWAPLSLITIQTQPAASGLLGLPPSADDPNACGSWFYSRLRKELPFLDNESRRLWAANMGSNLGRLVATGQLTEDWVVKMWSAFTEPLNGALTGTNRLVYAEVIRAYVEQLPIRWRLPASKWQQHFGQRRNLHRLLRRVDEIKGNGLILGVDQFFESRVLKYLLEQACRDLGITPFATYPLQYGFDTLARGLPGASAADVSVRNWLTVPDVKPDPMVPIFLHRGYYAFAQHAHVASLLEVNGKGIPDEVKKASELLLSNAEECWSTETLNARCWIAFRGGMRKPPDEEFNFFLDEIKRRANMVGESEEAVGWQSWAPNRFDQSFEAFVQGETRTFMGGSVHSRLLMRWLQRPLGLILILRPEDFREIIGAQRFPVPNILAFSDRLRDKRKSALRTAIRNVYREAWRLLSQLAAAGNDSDTIAFFRDFMCDLVSPDSIAAEWDARWSFVGHTQDIGNLLTVDNVAFRTPGHGGSKKRKGTRRESASNRLRLVSGR